MCADMRVCNVPNLYMYAYVIMYVCMHLDKDNGCMCADMRVYNVPDLYMYVMYVRVYASSQCYVSTCACI